MSVTFIKEKRFQSLKIKMLSLFSVPEGKTGSVKWFSRNKIQEIINKESLHLNAKAWPIFQAVVQCIMP